MRSSKDRTIEKKRRSKAMKVQKTEASRRKRLANKAKREEIHAIDPDMKIAVKNQRTFDQYGNEVEVIDGKIKPVLVNGIYKVNEEKTYNAESDGGRAINDQVEKERLGVINKLDNEVIEGIKIKNKSALERLTDRFKKKKIEL